MTTVHLKRRRHALAVLGGTLLAATGAKALRPTEHLAAQLGPIKLSDSIPTSFGAWRLDILQSAELINPEVSAKLAELYSELLTRTYVNRDSGYRIMLSVAYGGDQSDSLSLHYPDVCYPSQGFAVNSRSDVKLFTPFGHIPARRLTTKMSARYEPLTYWVVIGDRAVSSGIERKLAQFQYAARGLIPDGLLFRLSSIDSDAQRAFDHQASFAQTLASELSVSQRRRLLGLSPQ